MTPAELIDETRAILDEMECPPDNPDEEWRADLAHRLVVVARDLLKDEATPEVIHLLREVVDAGRGGRTMPVAYGDGDGVRLPFTCCR